MPLSAISFASPGRAQVFAAPRASIPSPRCRRKGTQDPRLAALGPGGITEQENWKYLKFCLGSLLKGIIQGKENPSLDQVLEKPV